MNGGTERGRPCKPSVSGTDNDEIKASVQNKIKKHMPEIAENFIHLAQYITKSGHDLVLFFQKFYDNLRLLLH